MNTITTFKQPGRTAWRALAYFNLYRFLVAFLFVALYWIGQLPEPLGIYDSSLFAITTHIYLALTVTAHIFVHIQRPPHAYQVFGQVMIDIVCFTLMMYASAGLNSGFGMMLVITVAGGGLLSIGKIGILYGALATLAVLGHEIYVQLVMIYPPPNYTHAGFLGLTFFVTAFISQVFASRVKESEALAQSRAADVQKLANLNDHIVQRLQAGIIVIDDDLRVSLINEAAKRLLGIDMQNNEADLMPAFPEKLREIIKNWKAGNSDKYIIFESEQTGIEIQASIVTLKIERKSELLIFMEDLSMVRQRAQQMKLASLGRLTASIAHEVRNPLGAISHAGQLLSESSSISDDERRLTSIIDEHSQRVNQIIENILNLSRRDQADPITLDLGAWLEDFKTEFESRHNLKNNSIKVHGDNNKVIVKMDSLQLHQVLWNLAENGLRYSKKKPYIEIYYSIHNDTERPYVDIIDNGPGISAEDEGQLFEPFFTTEPKGSGLGLYIARELCEANQASLNLFSNTGAGCRFRLMFSHPDKHLGN